MTNGQRSQVRVGGPIGRGPQLEYQAVLHTTDSDFARFPGLRWRNPLAQA
jgi:hypothetical protein